MAFRKLISNRNVKKKLKMNKQVYLGLSTLEISKTLMYIFWYDYIKPKYQNNSKICYMDKDSFVLHIQYKGVYKDISDDIEHIKLLSNIWHIKLWNWKTTTKR